MNNTYYFHQNDVERFKLHFCNLDLIKRFLFIIKQPYKLPPHHLLPLNTSVFFLVLEIFRYQKWGRIILLSIVSHGLKIFSLLLGASFVQNHRSVMDTWIVVYSVLVPRKYNQNFYSRSAILHCKLTCCY